jgi:hypothetical protein
VVNRKLLIGGAIAAVVVVAAVFAVMLLNAPPAQPSPLFSVTGKQQSMETTHSDYLQNGYDVINWNFTVVYNGEKALQNVNIYRNNQDLPIKTVPEVTKGWAYENIWTPGDITANATIIVAWQGGTETYEFQP